MIESVRKIKIAVVKHASVGLIQLKRYSGSTVSIKSIRRVFAYTRSRNMYTIIWGVEWGLGGKIEWT